MVEGILPECACGSPFATAVTFGQDALNLWRCYRRPSLPFSPTLHPAAAPQKRQYY
jgi:hypothetical protein